MSVMEMRIKRGREVAHAVCDRRSDHGLEAGLWFPTVLLITLVLRSLGLFLLTIMLRPPWEAPGKAEKLGCWVNWRGAGIFLAKKGTMVQQTLFIFLVLFPPAGGI